MAALLAATFWTTASGQKTAPEVQYQVGASAVLVPVVVRDRDGRAVAHLDRESFQLFDNGKPQQLTAFYVERAMHSSTVPARTFLAYYIDDGGLDESEAASLRRAALETIANTRSGDRIALLTASCRVSQDFTDDGTKLSAAIDRIQAGTYPSCHPSPDQPLQIAHLRGLVKRMRALPGARTITVISPGMMVAREQETSRTRLIDEAAQGKVTINVIRYTGAGTRVLNAVEMASRESHRATDGFAPAPILYDPGSLDGLARGSGGTLVEASNSWDVAFRRLAAPDVYYVLAFAPEGKPDGRYHKLRVDVKPGRKVSVSAREGYFAVPVQERYSDAEVNAVGAPNPPAAISQTDDVVARRTEHGEFLAKSETVSFSTGATLVLVPVVVRDREGHAVAGLGKQNFQIQDSGKRQNIAHFAVETAERPSVSDSPTGPTGTPGRAPTPVKAAESRPENFIAYLIDDVHIRIGDLAQVRKAVSQYVVDTLDSSTRIAIATTSGRGAMVDFTAERNRIVATLDRITAAPAYRSMCYVCGDLSFLHAYKVTQNDRAALQLAVPIVTKGGSVAPTDGLKQRLNPKEYTPLEMQTETRAIAAVEAGEHETELSLSTLRNLARRMASLPGKRTLVLIGHGFLVTTSLQAEFADTMDRVIRAGVVVHTLNTSGLRTGWEMGQSGFDDDTVGPTNGNGGSSPYVAEAREIGAGNLRILAESTGGIAVENSNDYLGAVRRLSASPDHRYVLGFEPRDLKADGRFHPLTIKLSNVQAGLAVQARRGYYAPKNGQGLTDAAAQDIENAVFAHDETMNLPVEIQTEIVRSDSAPPIVGIYAHIDLRGLHFRTAGGRNAEDVAAVTAVFDRDGNFLTGHQQLLRLRLRNETLANVQEQRHTIRTTFRVEPGLYTVRVVIRSAVTGRMSTTTREVAVD